MSAPPVPQAETGRDPTTGRFLPGASGNPRGRPARPSAIRIAAEAAEARNTTLEHELAGVFDALFVAAKSGCVRSAALLLDALVEKDPTKIEVTQGERNLVNMPEEERAARITYFLRLAERRARAADADAAADANGEADVGG